jgi:Zn-dependent M28 family amino/carboxypeptidase
VAGAPGANDNGSGVAAVLELARLLRDATPARTLRCVLFVNEEPPFDQTDVMGSRVYARRSRERGENIVGMFSLETVGWYSEKPGSQRYPFPLSLFYPSTGNFIAFVSNLASRALLHEAIASFRRHAGIPSEGVAAPAFIPGVDWSDHWSFWQEGWPALMVTDTAPYRYPHYHAAEDTPDKVDYERLARLVTGLHGTLRELAQAP